MEDGCSTINIKKLYHYVIKQAIQGGKMKDGVKEFNNSKIRK